MFTIKHNNIMIRCSFSIDFRAPWQDPGGPGDLEGAEGNRFLSLTSMADSVSSIVSFNVAKGNVMHDIHMCVEDTHRAGPHLSALM